MKVLQIIDSLNIGGAERMCLNISNMLSRNGHQVTVLYFNQSAQSITDQFDCNISIKYIPRSLYNPIYYLKIAKFCNSFEIIHIHLRSSLKAVYIASFFMKNSNIIFHDHVGTDKLFNETSKGLIIKNAIRSFKYVAVYDDLRIKTIKKFNLLQEKTYLISNFTFIPKKVRINLFEFDKNNLSILVIGNIKQQKNQLFLIDLAKSFISKDVKNFKFHLIGKIQEETYYLKFINEVEKNNLKNYFTVYTNYNDFSEIDLKVNFALMPSKDESGPIVNIEYLILGIPFLTNKVGEITSILYKDIPEIVIDELISNLWVEKILNFDSADTIVTKYKDLYDKYFSEKKAYNKWIELYSSFTYK